MQDPLEFYTTEKSIFEQESSKLKKQLTLSGTIRLLVFLMIIFGLYFFFGNSQVMIITGVIGFILFLFLVSRHTDLQHKRDLIDKLIQINTTELKVLDGEYLDLDEGTEFVDPSHYYSYDIDLFGRGSFFQYINRTSIKEGRQELFKTLTGNSTSNIELKQEAIKELAQKPKWRQQFSAIASLTKVKHSSKAIVDWIHNYQPVFPRFLSILPVIFSIISLILIALISLKCWIQI